MPKCIAFMDSNKYYSTRLGNRISGVMVNVLVLSAVDRGFESNQRL